MVLCHITYDLFCVGERKSEQVVCGANRTVDIWSYFCQESQTSLYKVQLSTVVHQRNKVAWPIFDAHLVELFLVRYGTLDVEDDRIGECAFDLSAYHL